MQVCSLNYMEQPTFFASPTLFPDCPLDFCMKGENPQESPEIKMNAYNHRKLYDIMLLFNQYQLLQRN